MGRGDKRSKRGKRTLGSFGVKRKARIQTKVLVNTGVVSVEAKTNEESKSKVAKPKTTKAKKES